MTASFVFDASATLTLSASADYSFNTAPTLTGDTAFIIGNGASISNSKVNADMTFNIPAADDQTWTNVTVTNGREGDLIIDDAIAITLSGTTAINSNIQWTALTALTIDSGAGIYTDARGCANTGGSEANGFGPNGSNVCIQNTAGYGGGSQYSGGGAGHGGVGGSGNNGNGSAGTVYDSNTSPVLFGSSGGKGGAASAGSGGGAVRLNVSGTLTHNGTISSDGGSGALSGNYGSGAGSGGSVYITVGTVAGTTGTFSADGGDGPSTTYDGGGGGGGSIRVEFESNNTSGAFLLDAGADTIGGSGASIHVAGGSAYDNASPGATGSLSIYNTNPTPVVTVVGHTPSAPFTDSVVTLNATATDSAGVTEIKIYLGAVEAGNLKKTCTYGASQTTANCSVVVGQLARANYTTNVVASDGTQTDSDSESWSVGGYTTSNTLNLSRNAAGATGVDFDMSFTLGGADTGTLTVTFPAGFTVTQAFQSGSCSGGGTIDTFTFGAQTLTAVKTACVGTVTVSDAQITLHSTPGAYEISWTNDSGTAIIAVVDSDQVSVSGTVNPTITFNVGSQAAATACNGTFTTSGGTLGLGTLSTSTVTSSDAASIPHICSRVSHNGTGGAVVSVKSLYGEMRSTSVPADTITSATATPLSVGVEGYGMCVGSGGSDTGLDVTVPVGSSPVRVAPFNNATCTNTGHNIGGLTGSTQTIWSLAGPSQNAFARIYVKASISAITEAHDDYTDTLTFIATGTY
ncbi:beta strand repeat-containing protein [Patescibacteria group bacterium]